MIRKITSSGNDESEHFFAFPIFSDANFAVGGNTDNDAVGEQDDVVDDVDVVGTEADEEVMTTTNNTQKKICSIKPLVMLGSKLKHDFWFTTTICLST